MSQTVKMAHLSIPSTHHRPQDALHCCFFEHDGEKVYVGAVSDGCTSDDTKPNWHPELGARWLVKQFCQECETGYIHGLRGRDLIRQTAKNLALGMKEYQPQDPTTESICFSYSGYVGSDELVATLFGFVLDQSTCSLILNGNGMILINGRSIDVDQEGGDRYSQEILAWPEEEWNETLSQVFTFVEFETNGISSLGVATDGLSGVDREYSAFCQEPDRFIEALKGNDYSDDMSVIALSLENRSSTGPNPLSILLPAIKQHQELTKIDLPEKRDFSNDISGPMKYLGRIDSIHSDYYIHNNALYDVMDADKNKSEAYKITPQGISKVDLDQSELKRILSSSLTDTTFFGKYLSHQRIGFSERERVFLKDPIDPDTVICLRKWVKELIDSEYLLTIDSFNTVTGEMYDPIDVEDSLLPNGFERISISDCAASWGSGIFFPSNHGLWVFDTQSEKAVYWQITSPIINLDSELFACREGLYVISDFDVYFYPLT